LASSLARHHLARVVRTTLAALVFGAALAGSAEAFQLWAWSYRGPGVKASGRFTTGDTANADGFYEITGIKGEANGVRISGLQPTGTSIPGNAGYPVDNLVRRRGPHLTKHGFAFLLANGAYANPFYGAHFSEPGYYAFLSDPLTGRTSEPAIKFTATVVR
jgi:hypothetical protein